MPASGSACPTKQMIGKPNAWYGWSPDKPDQRDRYRVAPPATLEALPQLVDLRPGFSDCYDQGELGSCTANAIGGAMEFDQRKQGLHEFTPARLFIYYNERVMEGTVGEDAGAEIRDGIKSVNELGAPAEKYCPYRIDRFTRKPTMKAYIKARAHPALLYERICQELEQLKACLASGFPFVFGFTVYESFESKEVALTGDVHMPGGSEQVMGGHAVCAVGYDDLSERFLVRNSWGTDWGINGYFTMPYIYLIDRNLADDFWVIRLVK